MEFRDVHELVINKLRSVVIRYRLPLSPPKSPVSRKIYRTFSFNFLCSLYENDFLSVESGFLKFLSKTCWLFVRNFLIICNKDTREVVPRMAI